MKYIFYTLLLLLTFVAADKYQLTFINDVGPSDNLYLTLAIYQDYPNQTPDQISVAWKKTSAAYQQIARIRWDITYSAMLINYPDTGGVDATSQTIPANMKDVFEVVDDQVSYNGVIS